MAKYLQVNWIGKDGSVHDIQVPTKELFDESIITIKTQTEWQDFTPDPNKLYAVIPSE